jgi:hypothetical protein
MSDLTVAASANAFTQLFNHVRDHFTFSRSDSADFGPFSASYSVALHLEGGSVALNDDNTIEVQHVDVVWDTLEAQVCFDLPDIPGFCIVPDPWNGCLVGFPTIPLPSICAPLDLSGLVSEISDIKAGLAVTYFVDPARLPAWSDLDAELNGHPNQWQVFVKPEWVHVDPLDLPATIGNLLENAVKAAIDNVLSALGLGWASDVVFALLGPLLDAVKAALQIAGDFEDWLSDLLGHQFDLLGLIETAVAEYLASQFPIQLFEDPLPILAAEPGLIPVKLPIRDLTAMVDSHEMVVTANVGG